MLWGCSGDVGRVSAEKALLGQNAGSMASRALCCEGAGMAGWAAGKLNRYDTACRGMQHEECQPAIKPARPCHPLLHSKGVLVPYNHA